MPISILNIPIYKELVMRRVDFDEVDSQHLIDLYFKLEMIHLLERIRYEYERGSFNTTV